jgi:hypothetical protein
MLRLIALCLLLAAPALAQPTTLTLSSQPVADRNTSDADARSELEVTVSVARGVTPYEMGTFQPIFTFNQDALEFPGQSGDPGQGDPANFQFLNYVGSGVNEAGETYTYNVNTVTNRLAGEVSVNVSLGSTGAGQDVTPGGLPVVRIYFKIKDPTRTAELAWNQADTEILRADNRTQVPPREVMYVGDDGALPVELSGFEALASAEGVARIQWQTASETNNQGFGIEARLTQSADARVPAEPDFSERAWVGGAGTTTEARSYAADVRDLIPGRYAFRLRQVDLDGAVTYSSVVELAVEQAPELRLDLPWPHPVGGSGGTVGF